MPHKRHKQCICYLPPLLYVMHHEYDASYFVDPSMKPVRIACSIHISDARQYLAVYCTFYHSLFHSPKPVNHAWSVPIWNNRAMLILLNFTGTPASSPSHARYKNIIDLYSSVPPVSLCHSPTSSLLCSAVSSLARLHTTRKTHMIEMVSLHDDIARCGPSITTSDHLQNTDANLVVQRTRVADNHHRWNHFFLFPLHKRRKCSILHVFSVQAVETPRITRSKFTFFFIHGLIKI